VQQSYYNAIKAVNPSAIVTSPAFNGGGGNPFLAFYQFAGGAVGTGQTAAQVSDVSSLHLYTSGPPNSYPETFYTTSYNIPAMQATLNANGMVGKPQICTECGWGPQYWINNTGFDKVAY